MWQRTDPWQRQGGHWRLSSAGAWSSETDCRSPAGYQREPLINHTPTTSTVHFIDSYTLFLNHVRESTTPRESGSHVNGWILNHGFKHACPRCSAKRAAADIRRRHFQPKISVSFSVYLMFLRFKKKRQISPTDTSWGPLCMSVQGMTASRPANEKWPIMCRVGR